MLSKASTGPARSRYISDTSEDPPAEKNSVRSRSIFEEAHPVSTASTVNLPAVPDSDHNVESLHTIKTGYCFSELSSDRDISEISISSSQIARDKEIYAGLREKIQAAYDKNPPRKYLYSYARRVLEARVGFDTIIGCHDGSVNCHRIVLDRYSETIREAACNVRQFGLEPFVSCETFKWIYGWMLKDDVDVPIEKIVKIFMTAKYLNINELLAECWYVFDSGQLIAEDLAFSLYVEAHQYREKQITLPMLSRMSKYFLFAVASPHFVEMDIDDLQSMIKLNALGVNTEFEVFMSVIMWLSYNWHEREKHVEESMRYVRFSLMAPWYLTILMKSKETAIIDAVVTHPDVLLYIQKAITFTTGLIYFHKFPELFASYRKTNRLEPTIGRQWIYDELCPYHYLQKYPCRDIYTYENFLAYIGSLRDRDPNYWHSFKYIPEYPDFRWLLSCPKHALKGSRLTMPAPASTGGIYVVDD